MHPVTCLVYLARLGLSVLGIAVVALCAEIASRVPAKASPSELAAAIAGAVAVIAAIEVADARSGRVVELLYDACETPRGDRACASLAA